jgi:hypothetical protein
MVNVLFWFIVRPDDNSDSIRTVVTRYEPRHSFSASMSLNATIFLQYGCCDHDDNDTSYHSFRPWLFVPRWLFRWRVALELWYTQRFTWYRICPRSAKYTFGSTNHLQCSLRTHVYDRWYPPENRAWLGWHRSGK